MRRPVVIAAFALLVLSACTSTVTERSEEGSYRVEMRFRGGTLKTGKNLVRIRVYDSEGGAVEGAEITLTPWMPEMDHGAPWVPKVVEEGNGRYRSNIPLTMGGHWEIRMSIRSGEREDTAVFDFPSVKG